MHIRRFLLLALTSFTLLAAGLRAQATYVYTDLGDLPVENQKVLGVTGNVTQTLYGSDAFGISNNGRVVGDVLISASNITLVGGVTRGIVSNVQREMTYFGGVTHSAGTYLSGNNSAGYGINSNGVVAGYSDVAGTVTFTAVKINKGVFTNVGGTAIGLSYAYAINEVGHVTGEAFNIVQVGRTIYSTQTAMINTTGQPVFLKDLTPNVTTSTRTSLGSVGRAINSSNQVAGSSAILVSGFSTHHAAIMQQGHNAIDLGTLPGPINAAAFSYAYGINNAGDACGYSTAPIGTSVHAFLYSPGSGMTDLGVLSPGGRNSAAWGMNNSGTIVGEADVNGGVQAVAMIWTQGGGMQDLNTLVPSGSLGDWVLFSANAVNDSGQIVGDAVNSNGVTHGFLLTPSALATPLSVSVRTPDFTALVGQNVTIPSNITGSGPTTFQWYNNGTAIAGQTSANLSLSNVQLSSSANYSVTATNLVSATSTSVNLSIIQAATINTQPVAAGALAGRPASFTVGASGTGTLSYVWQVSSDGGTNWTNVVNNSTFSGSTTPTLSISVTTLAMNGQLFRCVLNNVAGIPAITMPAVLAVGIPPSITLPPGNLTVNQGNNANLTVTAIGTTPVSYQWSHAGVPIVGANSTTLSLTNVQTPDAGAYSIAVVNPLGSATATASVTVVLLPHVTKQPVSVGITAGKSATFSTAATGTPTLVYQWQSSPDGNNPWTNLSNDGTFSGVTTTTLTVTNASLAINGTMFRCVVNNPSNVAVPSNGAQLTVGVPPSITTGPLTQAANQGTSPVLTVLASGTAPLTYQWKHGTALIVGATSSSYTITNAQTADAGAYSVVVSNAVGNATASANVSVVILPAITSQPVNSIVIAGKPTSFKVTVTGTPTLTYQWQSSPDGSSWTNVVNAPPFSGSNTATLAISNATLAMNGTQFRVVANNGANPAAPAVSNAVLLSTGLVPTIAVPADGVGVHTINQNASITLSVTASGTAPFTYQWSHGTSLIGGATSANFTIGRPQAADAGAYSVLVTNAYGNLTSTGNLSVIVLPVINSQTGNLSIIAGKAATFSVVASGTPTLTYQWQSSPNGSSWTSLANNGTVAGVTTNSLSIPNATLAMNATQFRVLVNNASNITATSNPSILSTGAVPTIITPVGAHTINQNASLTLSVTPAGTAPFTYQWSHGTSALGGATSANFTIGRPQAADAGAYSVLVTNGFGNVTSTGNVSVILLPQITTQPANSTVTANKPTSFNVVATGTPTLTYQWQSSPNGSSWSSLANNGTVAGVTTANLSLPNATLAMNGTQFRVLVNNASNVTATSNAALLNTGTAPIITTAPGNQTINQGGNTSFTVVVSGNSSAPLSYQWSLGNTTISAGSGGTSPTLSINIAQSADAGKYTVAVASPYGAATASANLTVINLPGITIQPGNQTIVAGKPAAFKVVATGTPTLTYQWQSSPNGTSWSNLTDNGTVTGSATANLNIPATALSMNGTQFRAIVNNGASPSVPATSNAGLLSVGLPPSITSLTPANSTINQNSGTTLTVALAPNSSTAPLTYQWSVNGVTLGSQTNSTLNIPSAQAGDAGKYAVLVTNAWGNATTSTNLTVILLPVINSGGQPASFAGAVGKSATFSVSAGGSGPLSYQWQVSTDGGTTFNNILSGNTTFSGATTTKLTVGTTSFAMNGWKFKVTITNASGVITTSTPATLTVGNPPVITSPPTNKTAKVGDNVSFSVLASGDPTLAYQWFLGVNSLPGQTGTSLNLTNVHLNDSGNYFVTVTNAYGNASGQATLVVNAAAIAPSLVSGGSSGSSASDQGINSDSFSGFSSGPNQSGDVTVTSGSLASVIIVPGSTLTPADVSPELLATMNLNAASDVALLPAASIVESGSVTYAVVQFRQAKSAAGSSLSVQYGYGSAQSAPSTWLNLPSNGITQQADADASTSVYQARIPVPAGQTIHFKISTAP